MVCTMYPHWWSTLPKGDGNPFARIEDWAYNRTGSALVKGKVYSFDLNLTATAESSANSEGITLPATTHFKRNGTGSAWRNIVTCPTQLQAQYGFHCLALENTPDNERAKILIMGEGTIVGVAGTDNLLVAPWTPLYIVGGTNLPVWSTANKVERKIAVNLAAVQYADTASAAVLPTAQDVSVYFCAWGL